MEKLYVIVRADLPAGVQFAQGTHAALAFALQYPQILQDWAALSENLVVLACPDENALGHLMRQAAERCIRLTAYHEPAFQNALTACAFSGEVGRLVSPLPLALREPKAEKAAA